MAPFPRLASLASFLGKGTDISCCGEESRATHTEPWRASGDTRGLVGAMTLVLNNAQAKPVPSYTAGLLHSISQPRTLSSPGRVSIPPRCTGIRAAEGACESPRRTSDRAVRHPERAGSRDERGRSASGTRLRAREAAVDHRVRGRAQGLQMAHSNPCLPSSLGRAVVAAVADAIMLPSAAHAEDYSHQPRSSPHYNPSQLELQHTMLSNPPTPSLPGAGFARNEWPPR